MALPKPASYAAWRAGLSLLPEEMDASRRDAARAVTENLKAGERFAAGSALPSAPPRHDVPALVWYVETRDARGALVGRRGPFAPDTAGFTSAFAAEKRAAEAFNRACSAGNPMRRTVRTVRVPAPALVPLAAMVAQPVQQQQAQARETAAEWGARMLAKRPAPRPVREDSPAMKAALAIAGEAGRAYGEAQNAVRAELDITAAPARAGRYGRAA